MSNGDVWIASISYDGTNLNAAVQDGANPAQTVISNYAIDMTGALGTNQAYVGFTSGTGGGFENHDILSWQFANTTQLANVPEPATVASLAIAMAGLGLLRPRRR